MGKYYILEKHEIPSKSKLNQYIIFPSILIQNTTTFSLFFHHDSFLSLPSCPYLVSSCVCAYYMLRVAVLCCEEDEERLWNVLPSNL